MSWPVISPLIQKDSSSQFSLEIKYASMSEWKKNIGEFSTLNTWDPAFYIGRGLCPFKAKCLTRWLWPSASLHSTLTFSPDQHQQPSLEPTDTHLEIFMRKFIKTKSRRQDRIRNVVLARSHPTILSNIKMLLNTKNGMGWFTIIEICSFSSWSSISFLFIQLRDFSSEDPQTF